MNCRLFAGRLWHLDGGRHEGAEDLSEIDWADAFVMVDFDEAFDAFVKMA